MPALRALFPPRKKFLVAVSGGADSMALLELLVESGAKSLVVCHLNHGLRGRAADQDEAFVKKHCARLGLKCLTQSADIRAEAEASGESIETAARHRRHRFFAECAQQERCPRVVLAHHADDQVETMIWNLLRGSHGWKAMQEQQELRVGRRTLTLLRPLLSLRRDDLRAFLLEKKITWREDASNAESIATRNRIRLEVLPLLANVAQRDIVPSLLRQLAAQDEMTQVSAWAVAQCQAIDPQGRLHRKVMQALPPAMQTEVLRDYLAKHQVPGISRELLLSCRALIDDDAFHQVNLPGSRHLHRRAGRIFIE